MREKITMSVGLDEKLNAIPNSVPDEGGQPDTSGSVAATSTPSVVGAEGDKPVGDDKTTNDQGTPAGQPPQSAPEEKTTEQVLEELRQQAQPQEGDSPVIKNLRNLLKTKVEGMTPAEPDQSQALSDQDRDSLEMIQGLFGYDLENDRPTTRTFIDKVVQKDPTLVGQMLSDAIQVPMPNATVQGWTYGHELLQSMGLDPMKFNDLVRFSRGEIDGSQYGIDTVPEYIPNEYHEAYKQLNPVIRTDIDLYLRGEDPAQKAAALQTLQDKRGFIESQKAETLRTQNDAATFNQVVAQDVETQVEQTYTNLLDTVGTNKAFTEVKVSTDATVDSMIKSTIVNQICALGEENAVLAKRAVESFKQMGVDVDLGKVNSVLESIKKDTEIAVRAEHKAKANNQTSSLQAQEARARVSKAVGEAVSMANRIAGEALAKFAPAGVVTAAPTTEVNLGKGDSGSRQVDHAPEGVLKPADLDAMILNTSKALREGASA